MASGQIQYVSDELFHFAGRHERTSDARYDLLTRILRTGTLRSSPAEVSSMRQDALKRMRAGELTRMSALCFCDIPRPALSLHTGKYSPFGLSFKKGYLGQLGAKPVIYVPLRSKPVNGRGTRRESLPNRLRGSITVLSKHGYAEATFLEKEFYEFIKFFDEELPQDHSKNYYMEREWRIVARRQRAHLNFELKDVNAVMVPKGYRERLLKAFPMLSNRVVRQR